MDRVNDQTVNSRLLDRRQKMHGSHKCCNWSSIATTATPCGNFIAAIISIHTHTHTSLLPGHESGGFTLSEALFRKNVGALQLGRQTLFFLGNKLKKNWRHFSAITAHRSPFTRESPIFSTYKNLPLLLLGPLFGRTC